MGKKIFFLSLILLSVAMGLHWYKHKPKGVKRSSKPKVALSLEEMMLKEGEEGEEGEESEEGKEGEEGEEGEEDEEDEEGNEGKKDKDKPEDAIASASENVPKTLEGDTVIMALLTMKRNPFETSPYAQLVEEIAQREAEAQREEEAGRLAGKKEIKVANGNFTATIKTAKELVAVIDSRLYRKGDLYKEMKIVDIKTQLIALKQGSTDFLLPKNGVKININAETGQFSIEDSYQK